MAEPEEFVVPPDMFDRAWSRIVKGTSDFKLKRAKAKLEKDLYDIIEISNGHEAKKLPIGHAAYSALYAQANVKIDEFCATWKVERSSVEQQIPALRELAALTIAPHPANRLVQGVAGIIGIIVAAIVVGAVIGLITSGFHWTVVHLCR